jgi:mono/diheme cytochrome c family protein
VGVVLPGIVLAVFIGLPWLKRQRLIAGSLLGIGVVLIVLMTTVSYLSDHRDPKTAQQLARQSAQEEAWRHQPFQPSTITLATATAKATSGAPPEMYTKFCAQCHGTQGQGAQQGPLKFPPLLEVSSKPRRTVDDIMGLLKDPAAYGLQPPMRSFADKLTQDQMREIAEWIVKLKK